MFKTYGNEIPYLLLMILIFSLFFITVILFIVVNKFPVKSTPIPNQTSLVYTGIGMACNDILGCPNNLTCHGFTPGTSSGNGTDGKCYSSIGQKCQTIYDCASGASSCSQGVCISSTPGGIGWLCNPLLSGQCQAGLECLLSYTGKNECLLPLNASGCGNNNEWCGLNPDSTSGVKCSQNTCVTAAQHGMACTTNSDCGGVDFCSGGKCEPSQTITPGTKGAWCSPYSSLSLDPCNAGLGCNVSTDFGFPNGLGVCAPLSSFIGGMCDANTGCVPFGVCSNGVCVYPTQVNECSLSQNTACTSLYECVGNYTSGQCLGKVDAMCTSYLPCSTGSCTAVKINSISLTEAIPSFPTFAPISTRLPQFQTGSIALSENESGYTLGFTGGGTSFYFLTTSGIPQPGGVAPVAVDVSFTTGVKSFVINQIEFGEGGIIALLITTTPTVGSEYQSVYIVSISSISGGVLIIPAPNQILSYYSTPILNVDQFFIDPEDNNQIYILITLGNQQFLTLTSDGKTLVNYVDAITKETVSGNGISFFGRYLTDSIDGGSKNNVFYILSDALVFSGNIQRFYLLPFIPAEVAYTKSENNIYTNLEFLATKPTGEIYSVNIKNGVLTTTQLPGTVSNSGVCQSYSNPSLFFALSAVCSE